MPSWHSLYLRRDHAKRLAAKALAAEREALGIRKLVYLQNVLQPIDTQGIMRAADAANVKVRGGVEGLLKTLGILQEMGQLPLYDLYLPSPLPPDDKQHSRKQKVLAPVVAFSAA